MARDTLDTTMIRISFTPDGEGWTTKREFELFGIHQIHGMIKETLSWDHSGSAGTLTVEPWMYRIDMPRDRHGDMPHIAKALGVPLSADGTVTIHLGSAYDD